MQVDLLGPLRVTIDGEVVEITAAKERGIVELLALRAGRPVPVPELIGALWGESPPATARKTLQGYVSRLRRLFGADAVATEGDGYALSVTPASIDARRFEALAEEGRAALEADEPRRAHERFSDALDLWRGPPAADLAEGAAAPEVVRLEELRLRVVEDLADARLALGRHEELVPDLESLVGEHPYRESLWSRLVVALYRSGRQRDALRAYRRARDLLVEELGIEPGPELQAIERAVLEQDAALDAAPRASRPEGVASRRRTGLPTGTVTFVFTDIAESTRRWQEDPAMAAVLARHDDVVRRVVGSGSGHLLKHVGDGMIAVFPTAAGALESAVDIQRAVNEEDWGDAPLRVRVAVHTGEAEERDGDYFGPAVNLAARLVGAAHGGQVLASRSTQELVSAALPAGVSLLDLGEHRLRDIADPVRVFQVQAPGLGGVFPSLRTSTTAPSNLPEPRSSFVGREDDVARISNLVDTRRLVTLVGVGGAGKTRLAIEVARDAVDRFPDGVHFADLSSANDAAGVWRAVAEALRLPDTASTSPTAESVAESLIGHVRERATLLVLDNCEHIRDECAALADRVLDAAPGVTVLATSREALGVEGEQWWPVGSLELPDIDAVDDRADRTEAMRLLVERIRAVRPDFEIDAATRGALVELCVRLDGVPLALELAAGRAAHLGPREIADRLESRLSLLAGGRGRVPRQQTLHATLDWSYDLLDPEEQIVLSRLSVFSGGFTLAAVEGVCTDETEAAAFDVLASLTEKSLVVADTGSEPTRYRLLETVRLYGSEKLAEAQDVERTRARHRDWLLGRLERFPLDRCLLGAEVVDELRPEAENLRRALEWCAAEGRLDLVRRFLLRLPIPFYGSRRFADLDHWFGLALTYEQTLPRSEWLCHFLAEYADMARWSGDRAAVAESVSRLEAIIGDFPAGEPATALAHVIVAVRLSVFPDRAAEMERHCDQAVEHAGEASRAAAAWAPCFKVIALQLQGRDDEAAALVDQMRPTWEAVRLSVQTVAITIATVDYLRGRHQDALAALTTTGVSDVWAIAEEVLAGIVLAESGDVPAARLRLREVADTVRRGRYHPHARDDCVIGLAALASVEGDADRASRLLATVDAPSTPSLGLVRRRYLERARGALDRETRQRRIEEGQAMGIDEAIDAELARWERDGAFESAPGLQ